VLRLGLRQQIEGAGIEHRRRAGVGSSATGPGDLICPALARIRSLIAEDHARRVGRGTRQGGTPSEIVIVFSR
jgi:hypothetical protein